MSDQTVQSKTNVASPWARLIAYIIDVLVGIAILELVLLSIISSTGIETLLDNLLRNLVFLIFFLSILVRLVNSLLISQLGGTLGKLITGIRIVDKKDSNLSFLRAFFRIYIGYTVSKIFVFLGFIWILVDKQRRSWHDMIVGSWVVVRNKIGFVLGIVAVIALLAFNIFLGQTAYQRFNRNQTLFYEIFEDIVGEFEGAVD